MASTPQPPEAASPTPPPTSSVRPRSRTGSQLGYLAAAVLLVALTIWATDRPSSTVTAGPDERVSPAGVYDPVVAGEPLPDGFRQLLPRDAIRPVYDPVFVSAGDADFDGDAEVIGVEMDGEAKAYPVSFLNGREMVIDEIADVPIVVTW